MWAIEWSRNISKTTWARDFKFGMQLCMGNAERAHKKISLKSGRGLSHVTPKIFGIWSNISRKLLELETSNLVHGFVWRMTSRRSKISPKTGRGLGHVTPTIFGNTVGYPSDSLASCLLLFYSELDLFGWTTNYCLAKTASAYDCFLLLLTWNYHNVTDTGHIDRQTHRWVKQAAGIPITAIPRLAELTHGKTATWAIA